LDEISLTLTAKNLNMLLQEFAEMRNHITMLISGLLHM